MRKWERERERANVLAGEDVEGFAVYHDFVYHSSLNFSEIL
jgi:hypothetical protein